MGNGELLKNLIDAHDRLQLAWLKYKNNLHDNGITCDYGVMIVGDPPSKITTSKQCERCKLTKENASRRVKKYMRITGICYKPHMILGGLCQNFK